MYQPTVAVELLLEMCDTEQCEKANGQFLGTYYYQEKSKRAQYKWTEAQLISNRSNISVAPQMEWNIIGGAFWLLSLKNIYVKRSCRMPIFFLR